MYVILMEGLYMATEYYIIENKLINYKGNEKNVIIPEGVTEISFKAFQHKQLISVTIPDSVTSIEETAFYWCNSLRNVIIGNGITSISNKAFYHCENLTDMELKGNKIHNSKGIIKQTDNRFRIDVIRKLNNLGIQIIY